MTKHYNNFEHHKSGVSNVPSPFSVSDFKKMKAEFAALQKESEKNTREETNSNEHPSILRILTTLCKR